MDVLEGEGLYRGGPLKVPAELGSGAIPTCGGEFRVPACDTEGDARYEVRDRCR